MLIINGLGCLDFILIYLAMDKMFVKEGFNDEEWDRFILKTKNVSYQQTTAWAKVYLRKGWSYNRIAICDAEAILIGVQILIWQNKYVKIGYIPQGPCLIVDNEKLKINFIKVVKNKCKKDNITYLIWDVNYVYNEFKNKLIDNQFYIKPNGLPPNGIISATTCLDLNKDKESLLKAMSSSRRKNLKQSKEFSIHFREGARGDIVLFYNLMIDSVKRINEVPLFNSIEYFYNMWDNMEQIKGVRLFFASINGIDVCALFSFAFGDTFRSFQWGWNGKYSETRITHALYWYTIEWAKSNGFKKYDFVQVSGEVAEAYLHNKSNLSKLENNIFFGPTVNKMRWGGELIIYPGRYIYVKNVIIKYIIMAVLKLPYEGFLKRVKR